MPIVERTVQACIDRFRDLIAELVASTIGGSHVVRCTAVPGAGPTTATISFVQGEDPIAVPVQAKKLGVTLQFFFGQTVEAVKIKDGKNKGKFQLRTLAYRYRLQEKAGDREPALVRWEYKRTDPAVAGHPRHHVHVPCVAGPLDFDKVHVSTGWVMLEEVIRFIIHELGHAPPCGQRWPRLLDKSERLFYRELSSKGCPHASKGCCPLS